MSCLQLCVCPASAVTFQHAWIKKMRKDKNKKIQEKGKEGCREYDEEPNWHFVLLTCMTFQELYFTFSF